MRHAFFGRNPRRTFYRGYGRLSHQNIRNKLKKFNLSIKETNSIMNGHVGFFGDYLNFPFEVGDLIYNKRSPNIRLLIQKIPPRKFSSVWGSYQACWNIEIVNFRNGNLKMTKRKLYWFELEKFAKFGSSESV